MPRGQTSYARVPDLVCRRRRAGIIDVVCVYVGGERPYPTYRSIADYTEGVTVLFDPKVTTFRECLDFFFESHSPFRSCGGGQYASGVWWHDEEQRIEIEKKVSELEAANPGQKVGTIHTGLTKVYRAEEYHQKFYSKKGR
eukprot:TRINITY_DN12196_c0_g1_i7.p1 TRINITY_DN12196_c0_g1~~TRINITY_DN12196_c0_g1_i7.p1  ORF type:complete len:141 (+),score=23.19 TRINITY_DN12196_c0_g1_i7:461-883(+)